MNAIETNHLTRTFGSLVAVDDLALAIPEGTVFGFLGPNGAGKTTTVRMLSALIAPSRGSAVVAVLLTWATGGLFIAELAIFTDAHVVSHVVTEGWLILFFAGTPLLGLIAVAVMTAISSRVNDTRTAQQLSIWAVVPIAGIIVGELSGQFELTMLVAVVASLILIPVAILVT